MANITEQHLHHMAKRHHVTMRKYDAIKEKARGTADRLLGTLEVGSGAFLGGMLEGRTQWAPLGIPVSLLVGSALIVGAHLDTLLDFGALGSQVSGHINNVGNGFIASYIGGVGHNFGTRWREDGTFLPKKSGAPQIRGEVSQSQMDEIIARMQSAAGAGAHAP